MHNLHLHQLIDHLCQMTSQDWQPAKLESSCCKKCTCSDSQFPLHNNQICSQMYFLRKLQYNFFLCNKDL